MNWIRKTGWSLTRAGGALAIVSFPFSVSASQLGAFLALVGWGLFHAGRRGAAQDTSGAEIYGQENPLPFRFPFPFLAGLAIYLSLFLSLAINAAFSDGFLVFFQKGLTTEAKDVVLLPAGLWAYSFASTESGRRDLRRWFEIALWIILVAGFISIFTEFRLSNIPYHLAHGWETTAKARLQHFLMTFPSLAGITPPVHLYMPVGLMNTHLTYAAQLAFFYPLLFYRVLDPFIENRPPYLERSYWKPVGMLLVATVVLIFNNGRSAIAGLFLVLALSFYHAIRTRWGLRTVRILGPVALVLLLAGGALAGSSRLQQKLDRIVAPLVGEENKHTDYQRPFLWKAVLDIIEENPVFGVGPGHFEKEVKEKTLKYSIETPPLWYGYAVLQIGHAHNDLLHFLAIAGPLAAFFYLLFFGSLFYSVLGAVRPVPGIALIWGFLSIFGGGLLQCYFQDDEVLLPFWLLAGLALRLVEISRNPESRFSENGTDS